MEGPAAIWYQSISPQLSSATWDSFCSLLHERFDHDQHEYLLRQIFNIRQQTSVQAFVTSFSELVDQLISYAPNTDPLFFTQRFIDGLCPDIKAIVLVQRPQNFDTAVRLALLQEEVGIAPAPRAHHGGDWHQVLRPRLPPAAAAPLSLPPPPPRAEKAAVPEAPVHGAVGAVTTHQTMAAVKQYRCALGLCYKCNAKWSKDHVCTPEVLHAVEALWDSFSSYDSMADSVEEFSAAQHCCLAISKSSFTGSATSRSIYFQGLLQSIPVKILVDSGSTSSFIHEALVPRLTGLVLVPLASPVLVAGGTQLKSSVMLLQVPWSVGNCHFQSDFRVLPLGSFDVIIGMDWLAAHSPMHVHWHDKWLAIPY
jgi:hypothetical protein